MNHPSRTLAVLAVLTSFAALGFAQVDVGTPAFGTYGGGPDIINLANVNVHLRVPIMNKAGRGVPFSYVLTHDTSVWYLVGVSGSQSWQPVTDWGWRRQTNLTTGQAPYTLTQGSCNDPYSGSTLYYNRYRFSSYTDSQGVRHPFPLMTVIDEIACPGSYTQTQTASNGSGHVMTVYGDPSAIVKPRSGGEITPVLINLAGSGIVKDSNGNKVTSTGSVYTDTLGTTALTISGAAPNPVSYTYTGPSGAVSVVVNYSSYTVRTNFGCSGVSEYGPLSQSLVSSIALPDGSSYTFTYEATPGYPGSVTGRLAAVTLPTGGTISYAYTGSNNGIICADGSAAGLTRTTPDGTWTYARSGSNPAWVTTVTDPTAQANQTVLNFQKIFETQRQVYDSSSTSGTLLSTVVTCYNGNLTNCTTTAVTSPITRRTITSQIPGGLQSKVDTFYNSNGLVTQVDEYGFGSGAPGSLVRKTLTTYASLGNGISDRPSSVEVKDGSGVTKAKTTFSYDQTSVTATSGTPQKDAVTGARGNLTTVSNLVQGTTYLNRTFTYFDTGNVKSSTDVNSAVTNYTYGGCGNSFPTSVSLPLTLTRSMTWNCTGGVPLTSTDENSKTTTYTYNDAHFWRPATVTDPLTNAVNITYANLVTTEGVLNFNGGQSVVDVLATRDSLGRPKIAQKRQGPGSGTFDSVETSYDAVGRPYRSTLPYAGTAGQGNPSGPGTTTTYDGLGRAIQIADSGGGTVTIGYVQNDVLRTIGPAPTGENTKRVQYEYDALGRLTSVCEVTTATGSGTCGQTSPQTGYWTKYTYDTLGNLTGVTQNAQSGTQQTRTYAYDMLGRLTSEINPETGTTTYTYESATGCTGTFNGDLVKRVDAVGNTSCYAYDVLHRVTSIAYSGPYAGNTPTKKFVYDTATVNSVAMANAKARLAEAYTCTGACTAKTTDLGFSYSARGEVVDVFQSTPNSGGYYRITATYWEHGLLKTLSGLPGLPTFTSGVDGQGRPSTISASTGQNPVTNAAYNVASQPTGVTLGSLDSDAFSYDPNTGRITQYSFNVNGQAVTGNLTWNANGSLGALAITDPFNAANSQTCSFVHDDLGRIAGVNCGAVWSQTFSYDAMGNISKAGTSSFQPTYNTATNRISQLPGFTPTYDANGNLLNDSTHTYTWDAEGRPVGIDAVTLTYDALGRMVEQNRSGSYTQVVYDPTGGKLALMSAQTLQQGFVPLPGGVSAVYTAAGLSRYRHPDWSGSNRFASTAARGMYFDAAYAPYGEAYAQAGTGDLSFTQQNQDTVAGLYDFMFRQYHPVQGRWVSPDPAGLSAVSMTDPQSWNRYGYVGNTPLTAVDPLGLLRTDARGYFDNGCSINGFVASCAMVRAFAAAGGGGQFGFLCYGNCDALNSGLLRIGADNKIYHQPSYGSLEPWAFEGSPEFALAAWTPGSGTDPQSNACAGRTADDLVYTPSARQHIIDDHINGNIAQNSQYGFSTPAPDWEKFAVVQALNRFTFNTGTFDQRRVSGLIVFTTFVPPRLPFPAPSGRVWSPNPYVGLDRNDQGKPTNFNTLVLRQDCKTVLTSYPGRP